VFPRALLTALALGSGPFQRRSARLTFLGLLGIAVFLASLPQTLHNLQSILAAPEMYGSPTVPTAFLIRYSVAGVVGGGMCGLLGGWLRDKVFAVAARLSRSPLAPAANVG
jgi:hypothetical protein